MKIFDIYTASNGETFDIKFIPEGRIAYAIGPLPQHPDDDVGSHVDEYVSVYAASEEQAQDRVIKAIEEKIVE